MNSPPDSLLSSTAISASTSSGRRPQTGASNIPPLPHPNIEVRHAAKAAMDGDSDPASRPAAPPSPSVTSSSAIAVGSSTDAVVIQSIEKGEFAPPDDDTRSLTDSIRQHIVDGGLRYHAYHAGKYCFPNDETEQYRDDLKHNLTVHLCDGEFFFAPVQGRFDEGAEVLDLGTGTGKWCIDLADDYPNSTFHGMDLSPIQPDWVPENVSFVVDDIEHEAGWTYPENHFDYIHIRHTLHSIRDRPELWDRILRHLKPGGWFELQEFHYVAACDDSSCDEPYAWRDFCDYLDVGMRNLGSEMHGLRKAKEELSAAGFDDIRIKNLKCPVGPWAKKTKLQECGHILRDVILWGLNGIARKPFRDGLNWTDVQIEMFLVDVRKHITEERNGLPKFHSYFPFESICGRKPLNAA